MIRRTSPPTPAATSYVAEPNNERIDKFNSLGTWERSWGKDVIQSGKPGDLGAVFEVCTVATDCQAGAAGGLGGEMFFPLGVGTDASGNVYVGDTLNNRIQKFSSSGTWDRAWGKNVNGGGVFEVCTTAASCQAGSGGGLGGEMFHPFGVSTGPGGAVYVADADNKRVQKFSSSGTWDRAWGKNVNGGGVFGVCTTAASCLAGSAGSLGGEMGTAGPQDVATDTSGNVYASDLTNGRMQKFSSSGTWDRAWGKGVIQSGKPGDLGDVFEICAVAADCRAATSTGGLGGEMFNPSYVATAGTVPVYVADTTNQRIQRFLDDPPTITTSATTSVTIGTSITDQATLLGATSPTGTITFTAYGPTDTSCSLSPVHTSSAIAVSGNGSYNNSPAFTPSSVGTYRWRASYSGDINNAAVSGACNDANEASVVNSPPPPPSSDGGSTATLIPAPAVTGQRAAALKKCKKKRGRARKNCKKRANRLPI